MAGRRRNSNGEDLRPLRAQVASHFVCTLMFLLSLPGLAAAQNKCDSGKLKCMRNKALCVLKVHEKAIKKGETPDAARLAQCRAKFDDPQKGCVAKLEAKQSPDKAATICSVVGNTSALEVVIDTCVSNALAGIGNPVGPNKCDSKKLKCMRKKAVCLLKAHEKAIRKGEAPDAAKLSKCEAKFDDPEKGCIAKAEGKQNPDKPESVCTTAGNTAALEGIVDACVAEALDDNSAGGTPTDTPTPSATPTNTPTPTTTPTSSPTETPTCSDGGATPEGLTATGAQFLHQDTAGVDDAAESNDHFGTTLTTGDFDGDGFADLAIGIPDEDLSDTSGLVIDAGAVAVFYGAPTGLYGTSRSQFLDEGTAGPGLAANARYG